MEEEEPDKWETAFESRWKDEIRGFFNERKNVEDNAVMPPKAQVGNNTKKKRRKKRMRG